MVNILFDICSYVIELLSIVCRCSTSLTVTTLDGLILSTLWFWLIFYLLFGVWLFSIIFVHLLILWAILLGWNHLVVLRGLEFLCSVIFLALLGVLLWLTWVSHLSPRSLWPSWCPRCLWNPGCFWCPGNPRVLWDNVISWLYILICLWLLLWFWYL